METNKAIKKTSKGYTFLGLPDGYFLPTYEEALREYNYRKSLPNDKRNYFNKQSVNLKTVTRGGIQTDTKNGRQYVVQIRKEIADKDKHLLEYTSRGTKKLNVNLGELIVRTGKYYPLTKTFITDLVSIDPSYKDYGQLNLKISSTKPQENLKSKGYLKALSTSTAQTKINKQKRLTRNSKRAVSSTNSLYDIPKNDLTFLSYYLQALQEGDEKKIGAYDAALAKRPNKNLIWKGIWPHLSPYNTPELSALAHELLFTIHPGTRNEMGQMNWYNLHNGNLLQATAPNSLEYLSPESRAKTIKLVNPTYVMPTNQTPSNVVLLILQNADRFADLFNYALQHGGAFDYTPSSFNSSGMNVTEKYGGIGDFMDTYHLSPNQLYTILESIYTPKKKNGGLIKVYFRRKW